MKLALVNRLGDGRSEVRHGLGQVSGHKRERIIHLLEVADVCFRARQFLSRRLVRCAHLLQFSLFIERLGHGFGAFVQGVCRLLALRV